MHALSCVWREMQSLYFADGIEKSPFWMYKISASGYLGPFMDTETVFAEADKPRAFIPNGPCCCRDSFSAAVPTFIADETKAYSSSERSLRYRQSARQEICEFHLSKI